MPRMERFSWPVHFRNCNIHRRDWRSIPDSGNIRAAGLAGLLLERICGSGVFFTRRMLRSTSIRTLVATLMCALLWAGTANATTTKSTSTSATKASTHKKKKSKGKKSSRGRGQKAIDSERTQQIQEALIREHYLKGEPTGRWDDATQAALRRYQADNGWQNKTVPDSRALIKLGLGPNQDHLLNPETAMTTAGGTDPKRAAKPASADPPAQTSPNPATASPQQ